MGRERRKSRRVIADVAVDYRFNETSLFAYMTDISEVGVFVRCGNPYPAGTRLTLRFRLPAEAALLSLEGEVVWTQQAPADGQPGPADELQAPPNEQPGPHPGMGIRFVDVSEAVRRRLAALTKG
jgi:type IV pilus assembly protein PilZ